VVVEIDKPTQTLVVANAGVVRWIFNTSTGSGRKYRQGGKVHTAVTPSGDFRVFRRVDGWDESPLGRLYRPQYFNGGIAVHGYPVVPSTPASHGCVRVSLPAMDFLWGAGGMRVGTRVLVA
jgi:lipoprotein-anchoring transpeptidase ErfK/SrfK